MKKRLKRVKYIAIELIRPSQFIWVLILLAFIGVAVYHWKSIQGLSMINEILIVVISLVITFALNKLRLIFLKGQEDYKKLSIDGSSRKYASGYDLKRNNFYVFKLFEKEVLFPINITPKRWNRLSIVDNQESNYQIPQFVYDHFEVLMDANGESNVYNQQNIRVDDYGVEKGVLTLYTSRTTYYHSLVTN